jgi:hypothetical protein
VRGILRDPVDGCQPLRQLLENSDRAGDEETPWKSVAMRTISPGYGIRRVRSFTMDRTKATGSALVGDVNTGGKNDEDGSV